MPDERSARALELLLAFADRTGLTSDRPPQRYLWTDAFAVCSFLGLGRTELALRLVDQVHHTLGRHRPDDARRGWISGLDGDDATQHPTRGGLRIGKRLRERGPHEPFDDRLEWDRDGQYFHYLTRWMHALDQVARWTGEAKYNAWGRELAEVAHRAFTYDTGHGGRGMVWKMSVDLSRPLVPSMGHHDPLDGYVTCVQLEVTARELGALEQGPRLTDQAADFSVMIPTDLATADPLGLGGLLTDAWRLDQLAREGATVSPRLRDRLLEDALAGMAAYASSGELGLSADHRLAFRELGLSIGLAAVPLVSDPPDVGSTALAGLTGYVPLRDAIEGFWLTPGHRTAASWLDHENINDVMLATSLSPDGYLVSTP